MKYPYYLLLCAVLLLAASLAPADAAEFRAFWVDSWGSGFENPTATTTMINYVDSCRCNAVIVEIRKRGDAYYDSSYEPTATAVTPQAGYDCLADIVTKGHNAGLEVHAWVVAYRVWTSTTAPPTTSPNHVYNTHPEWFSLTNTGSKFASDNSFLDPGHPGVENFLNDVFMEIVANYDIDGLCLDYIRYAGTTWGYNPTAVARYNAEYGLSGNPSYTSTQWCNWRRDQVTNTVKRTYLEAKAIKPGIKIGAAVWNSSATGSSSYFANWDLWMTNHWLDYASPMAYTVTNSTFNGWVNTYTGQQHGHHVYPAQGSYMNTISNSMTQINYVRSSGLPGSEPYDYRVTNSGTVDRTAFKNSLLAGPYATTQSIPGMSWISSPSYGMLKGTVKDASGNAIYPATVTIQSKTTKNSGAGFYGFVDLSTGSYTVTASADGYDDASANVSITAGLVTTANLTLTTGGGGGNEIVIDNGSATFSGSWSTGTSSSDKYGSDYSFATTATSETAWARWTPSIPSAGDYDVYVWYPQGSNRSAAARYTIYYNGGSQLYQVNQTTNGGQWNFLGTKAFATGTSGYVKLGNGTSEASKVVMADAVKFVGGSAGDTEAPTTPTNLTATAVSSSQINLSWSASSDNVGVTGYNIYRDGGYLTSVTGTSYSNTGLSSNTTYTYRVSAYDAAGNESSQSSQASATTFSAVTEIIIDNTSGSFSCSANWTTGTSATDKYGTDYEWRSTAATTDPAVWTPNIPTSGTWAVYAWWSQGPNRSTSAPFVVHHSGGDTAIYVNQQTSGGMWNLLTTESFGTGTSYPTQLSCWTTTGYVVVADAVRWLRQ